MIRNECSDGSEFNVGRPAPFMVIVEDDCHTPTIHIPIASLPANLPIMKEALSASVPTNDPVVRPKDLLVLAFVSRVYRAPFQLLVRHRGRTSKIGRIQPYQSNRREPFRAESRRVARMMNDNCINRFTIGVPIPRFAVEGNISLYEVTFEKIVEFRFAFILNLDGLPCQLFSPALHFRNNAEIPCGR